METTCSVADCSATVKAHGMCAKHYMRGWRGGDPQTAPRQGRPADPLRATWRRKFPDMSDRSFARLWAAMWPLAVDRVVIRDEQAGTEQKADEYAIQRATRPNGSLNVAELERAAEDVQRERRRSRSVVVDRRELPPSPKGSPR
jgi:hypothetical protein